MLVVSSMLIIHIFAWTLEPGCTREVVEVWLRPGDLEPLEGMVADRRNPLHHVWSARIVLMTAVGASTMVMQAATGKGKPTSDAGSR